MSVNSLIIMEIQQVFEKHSLQVSLCQSTEPPVKSCSEEADVWGWQRTHMLFTSTVPWKCWPKYGLVRGHLPSLITLGRAQGTPLLASLLMWQTAEWSPRQPSREPSPSRLPVTAKCEVRQQPGKLSSPIGVGAELWDFVFLELLQVYQTNMQALITFQN